MAMHPMSPSLLFYSTIHTIYSSGGECCHSMGEYILRSGYVMQSLPVPAVKSTKYP